MKSVLRKLRNHYRKKQKLKKIKKGEMITFDQLVLDFKNLGIEEGDVVFVHSSLSRIGYVENGPETVIEALKSVIGKEGTLLFPAFSFSGGGVYGTISNPDYVFNPKVEPSYVGKISDVFWRMKGVERSLHPTHSVAAFGKLAKEITKDHSNLGTNWGKGTPFGKMLDLNAKMIGIGVKLPYYTFFHCVEDYEPDLFQGLYEPNKIPVKIQCENELKTFEIPYHNLDYTKDRIEVNSAIEKVFTEHFLSSGKLNSGIVGKADTLIITAKDFYDLTVELAKRGQTIYKV